MAAAREVIRCTFRLCIDLHAHVTAYPVIAATGPAERPAIEACRLTFVSRPRARPAAVDLDIAGRLLIDWGWRLEHGLHVGGVSKRCQRNRRNGARERCLQRHRQPPSQNESPE